MKNLIFILITMAVLVGCSKDGSKSRVLEGGSISNTGEPTPTDANFPELGPKP